MTEERKASQPEPRGDPHSRGGRRDDNCGEEQKVVLGSSAESGADKGAATGA